MLRFLSKQNQALLSELVRTDFKLRYQGSALGYAWSLLRPILLFAILYVVFVRFLKVGGDTPHYPVYLLLGIVIWNFFYEMTVQSTTSIVGRGDLIRKVRIPRWIIVLSSSLSASINLSLNLVVVAALMLFNRVGLSATLPLVVLVLMEAYLFALGISLFLSALYVRFRDVSYIWEVMLQAGFYLTPILYPLSRITNLTLQRLIMLNPLAQIIQDARYAVVTHQTITSYQLFNGGLLMFVPFVIVVSVLIIGVTYFRKESTYFAENI